MIWLYILIAHLFIGLLIWCIGLYKNKGNNKLVVILIALVMVIVAWELIYINELLNKFSWYARKYYLHTEDGRTFKTRTAYTIFIKNPIQKIERRIFFIFKKTIWKRKGEIE